MCHMMKCKSFPLFVYIHVLGDYRLIWFIKHTIGYYNGYKEGRRYPTTKIIGRVSILHA